MNQFDDLERRNRELEAELKRERERAQLQQKRIELLEESAKRAYRFAAYGIPSPRSRQS